MIEPTDADIGRAVEFRTGGKAQGGRITGFGSIYVFVRVDAAPEPSWAKLSIPVRREDLDWVNPAERRRASNFGGEQKWRM